MYSYRGKLIHVDLSSRRSKVEELGPDFLKKYLGGVGLASRILYDGIKPGCDPLGEDNAIACAVGAFTGTIFPTGNKFCMATKSPLTGFLGDSLSSSYWASALKGAGYDALLVTGKAQRPTYIFIDDGEVHFRDASHLWGKACFEAEQAIREELDNQAVRVATIGLAGEKMVRYACVGNDRGRQAGRTGQGAVMGSKNLKAIAVHGNNPVNVADLRQLSAESLDLIKKAQGTATEKYRVLGTVGNVLSLNRLGVLPVRNFQQSTFEAADRVSGEYLHKYHREKTVACSDCPIGCEQVLNSREAPYDGAVVSIDYESLYALGPCCGIDNAPAIIKAAELCDKFGLDTMSAGVTIAWAMECYEKGLLTDADTDGLELRFGNHAALVGIIEKIARREGIGALLCEGTRIASKKLGRGSEEFAIHVKGLELPGYEPRGLKTYALGIAVGTRGACHNRSAAYEPDIKGKVDRFKAEKGRGILAKEQEEFATVLDSLIICKFLRGCFKDFFAEAAHFYKLATGVGMTPQELKVTGERIWALKKAFNIREGWVKEDDWLPPRLLKEPLADGPGKGVVLTEEELRMMIDDYYRAKGWTERGLIPKAKLSELGLEDIAEEIGVG